MMVRGDVDGDGSGPMPQRWDAPRVAVIRIGALCIAAMFVAALGGCKKHREDLDYSYDVIQTWDVQRLQGGQIIQFESVFWEPDDSVSLRELITEEAICTGRKVLEIGTGTGLIAILCAQNGADTVVATDINPAAVANARYNAAMLAEGFPVEVRSVSVKNPSAYAVIKDKERFDLIISNPPWEDGTINQPADHAFYDPSFALMDSLLDGLPKHLNPGGRCLLAYGHVPAIKRLKVESERRGYGFKVLDDRELDDLEKDFLPGMLVEIRVPMTGAAKFKKASDSVVLPSSASGDVQIQGVAGPNTKDQ